MPEMTDPKQCVSDVMTTVHVIGIPWFASCLSQARYPESRLTVSRLLSRTQPRVSGLVSRAGFTILELITVLVVGGILTSFAMGRVTQIMSSQPKRASTVAEPHRNRLQYDNPQDCFRAVLHPSRDRFRGRFHDPMAATLSGRGAVIRLVIHSIT